MVDTNMNSNTNPPLGDGVRKLKKIKRPIRRITPVSPLGPDNGGMAGPSPKNLDAILDSQTTLPVANKQSMESQPERPFTGQTQPSQPDTYKKPTRFISEEDLTARPRFLDELMEGNLFTRKGVIVIAVAALLFGFIFAKVFTGGKTVVKDGLQGVVVNAEVPKGRARCGVAERTQGCVLYIMNPQRQDLQGRDFYDLASQLTGRQRFVVETGNMRYSSVKIRPGDIAQINIPPLQ